MASEGNPVHQRKRGPGQCVICGDTWTDRYAGAQVCTIRGLRIAEATAVMPFDYARLLFAGLIGLVVFGEVPGWWSLLGALVIVASTFFEARMEARDYKAESGPSG